MGTTCSSKREPEVINVGSSKSTGFEPTMMVNSAAARKRRDNNFLEILDRLNQEDKDDDGLRDKKVNKDRLIRTGSSGGGGIEANSSDETASQTYIGKELSTDLNPERIQLVMIQSKPD